MIVRTVVWGDWGVSAAGWRCESIIEEYVIVEAADVAQTEGVELVDAGVV